MDIVIRSRIIGDKTAIKQQVLTLAMSKIQAVVIQEAEAYLLDLQKHMGVIEGSGPYSDKAVRWSALDKESLEKEATFWYESGAAKKALVIKISTDGNRITAFTGIQKGSSAYDEVLWNELGFTPGNSDRLIRRPLFFPLADVHKAELNKRLNSTLAELSKAGVV